MAAIKSRYKPKNPQKYCNPKTINNIICRSSWERQVCIWLDQNPDVISWGSEVITIPYISRVDGKKHRYYIDFYIKFKDNKILLVEVKPHCQTQEPVLKPKQNKKRFITETVTYATNTSKWEYASEYASKRNAKFVIWTEHTLAAMGIKTITTSKAFKASKFKKPIRKI
jgi:hypothetical protein